jgi:hypothetical protein
MREHGWMRDEWPELYPAVKEGNLPEAWQAGTRFDFENPEYR